jgi:hypothetical protein
MWPFSRKPVLAAKAAAAEPIQVVSVSAKAVESAMPTGLSKFVSVLETIGKGFMKGLTWAVAFSVPVEKLIALIFPTLAPEAEGVADATTLIQNAVLLVEQKYAASGVQDGTGEQKLAEVLTLTQQAVTSLLAKAGITADTDYIQNLISAVVGILNVQQATPALVAAVPAATAKAA